MPQEDNKNQASPFSIISPKKSKGIGKTGIIVGSLIAVFLILSVVAGVLLVQQQQNVQPEAACSLNSCNQCSSKNGYIIMNTYNCNPKTGDQQYCNKAKKIGACNNINYCCPKPGQKWTTDMTACAGSSPYKPPSWCSGSPTPTDTPTPTPTPTATASSTVTPTPTATDSGTDTPTSTPTPTATSSYLNDNNNCGGAGNLCSSGTTCQNGSCVSSATSTPQATSRPIPVTGTDWPTVAGVGVGAFAIFASLLLAL